MGQVIGKVIGSSGRAYSITEGDDGVIYCTCPAWKFKKDCKHLQQFHATKGTQPTPALVSGGHINNTKQNKPTTLEEAINQAVATLGGI